MSGPCTVLPVLDSPATRDDLTRIITAFEYQDDVWTRSFLQTVIVRGAFSEDDLSTEIEDLLKSWGTKHIRYREHNSAETTISQGPYWLQKGSFHRVSRLYPDNADAFVVAVVQDDEDEHIYHPLGISAYGESNPASLSVAVPSRLYFKRNDSHPLAGMRIAVKDNTDLSGIRTGGSSRCYTRLYGPRKESAPIIQKLLDLGAIAVGKTKTTQFADTEWATGDWVDVHPPFTPRADGYQSPSGSSAGSGAAVAAYDWLDIATGTDGCGSLRSPAAIEGLFTMRPSHGSTSVEGIIPWGSAFDTFRVYARAVDSFASLSKSLYGAPGVQSSGRLPGRIIYPLDYWPVQHAESQASFQSFISKLEAYIGVKCTAIRLTDLWENTNPVGTNESLESYFHNALPWAYAPTQWQTYKTFQEDYWKAFGKTPYFNPEGQFKMDWLPTVTSEMHKDGLKKIFIFQSWFEENLISPSEDGTSEALLLLPWTKGIPDYRDAYRPQPDWAGYGWQYYMISPFARAPEMIIPIGQTSFLSKVTKREEWLPVSLGVIGARGSDVSLPALLQDFVHAMQLPTTVEVGERAFPLQSLSKVEQTPLHG